MAAKKGATGTARSRSKATDTRMAKRTPAKASKPARHKDASAHRTGRSTLKASRQKHSIVHGKTTAGSAALHAQRPASSNKRMTVGKATASPNAAPAKIGTPITEGELRAMPERDYMNPAQLAYFRQRLITMRNEVLDREVGAKQRLHDRENFADPADRATAEEEHWLDLRLRERESMLLRKIDSALQRIHDGEYGYCEKTGEAIGIPRLIARPTATVCVDVKDQDEKVETHFRDR